MLYSSCLCGEGFRNFSNNLVDSGLILNWGGGRSEFFQANSCLGSQGMQCNTQIVNPSLGKTV